jgi:hypothetical protein
MEYGTLGKGSDGSSPANMDVDDSPKYRAAVLSDAIANDYKGKGKGTGKEVHPHAWGAVLDPPMHAPSYAGNYPGPAMLTDGAQPEAKGKGKEVHPQGKGPVLSPFDPRWQPPDVAQPGAKGTGKDVHPQGSPFATGLTPPGDAQPMAKGKGKNVHPQEQGSVLRPVGPPLIPPGPPGHAQPMAKGKSKSTHPFDLLDDGELKERRSYFGEGDDGQW